MNKEKQILQIITDMHNLNVIEQNKYKIYFELILNILKLTDSECGYLGEVIYDNNKPKLFCKILIEEISNTTYDTICKKYESGLVFDLEDKIYGIPYYTKEPYITNDLEKTLKEKKLKPHCVIPNLYNYCNIPLIKNDKIIGFIALGNKKDGYSQKYINYFKNYFECCSIILESKIIENERQILEIISKAQKFYIQNESPYKIFNHLLDGIISLTNSEFGFIGEVLYDKYGIAYLKTMAITDIAWNDELKAMLKRKESIVLKNLNTLFGIVLTTKKLVISNDPKTDPRRGGTSKIPEGHPPLNRFCGIPFFMPDSRFVGMIGLGNSPYSYHSDIVQKMDAFLNSCSLLIHSFREDFKRKERAEIDIKLMAQISHELKTPLNSILGFTQLLKNDTNSKYVDYILESSQLLMDLVNNSLNLNRLDKYTINNLYIHINDYIEKYITNHQAIISKMGLTISNEIPNDLMIYCDKFLFERILRNLMSNAIKYNNVGGYIKIFCSQKNELFMTIRNSGSLKINMNEVFEPFQTSDKERGTGLGLSITKKIFGILGKHIHCEISDDEDFVDFIFTFDYKIRKDVDQIVYIEDNKMNQLLVQNILKNKNVTIKDSGKNILSYIMDYDILLLDLFLDEINGFDVIKILKDNNIHIPIVVITADTTTETLETLQNMNIKYFTKPIIINEFLKYMNLTFFNPLKMEEEKNSSLLSL